MWTDTCWFHSTASWAYSTGLLMRDGSTLSVLSKSILRACKTEDQTKHDIWQGNDATLSGNSPRALSPWRQYCITVLPRGYESVFWLSFVTNHSLSAYRQKDSLFLSCERQFIDSFWQESKYLLVAGILHIAKYPPPLTKIDFLINQHKFLRFQTQSVGPLQKFRTCPHCNFSASSVNILKNSNG